MPRCFVAQPFDNGGPFDERYDQVIEPAIREASLEAYRVDRDRTCSTLIDSIEQEILNCRFFLADISEDNPNVWFELGLAVASKKRLILICSDGREKFPFDVQHRRIIRYQKESPMSFQKLQAEITKTLKSLLRRDQSLDSFPIENKTVKDSEGLSPHELFALATVCENIDSINDRVSVSVIKEDMERKGFTKLAASLALNKLVKLGFVELTEGFGQNDYAYFVYGMSESGMDWLASHEDLLCLVVEKEPEVPF